MLESGADVNSRWGPEQLTALHLAAESGQLEVLQALIQAGADVDSVCLPFGENALHIAAYRGHTEVAAALSRSSVPVTSLDLKRRTPLHYAAEGGHGTVTVAEFLLAGGAGFDEIDAEGDSPLMLAALRSSLAMVHLLSRLGADPSHTNAYGQTAVDIAMLQLDALPRIGRGRTRRVHPDYVYIERDVIDILRLMRL